MTGCVGGHPPQAWHHGGVPVAQNAAKYVWVQFHDVEDEFRDADRLGTDAHGLAVFAGDGCKSADVRLKSIHVYQHARHGEVGMV